MRSSTRLVATALPALLAAACVGAAHAQQRPNYGSRPPARPQAKQWEGEGTVVAVQGSALQMKTEKDAFWVIHAMPSKSKVIVSGTAESDFLKPGLNVRFSGTIDKKGNLEGEVASLEIFSPTGKGDAGLFNPNESGENAKPVRNAGPGTYAIRGKLASFKDGQISVAAGGKKIAGKLGATAEIKVNLDQLSFAHEGDSVKVKATYPEGAGADPARKKQGEAVAEEITVTLAKPLASASKSARKTAVKPTARPGKPAESGSKETPFGEGAPKLNGSK